MKTFEKKIVGLMSLFLVISLVLPDGGWAKTQQTTSTPDQLNIRVKPWGRNVPPTPKPVTSSKTPVISSTSPSSSLSPVSPVSRTPAPPASRPVVPTPVVPVVRPPARNLPVRPAGQPAPRTAPSVVPNAPAVPLAPAPVLIVGPRFYRTGNELWVWGDVENLQSGDQIWVHCFYSLTTVANIVNSITFQIPPEYLSKSSPTSTETSFMFHRPGGNSDPMLVVFTVERNAVVVDNDLGQKMDSLPND